MEKGTLSYALDGEYMGVAFEDEELKKGPIFPAIALLHQGGCYLVTRRKPPTFFIV
jgi:E3 ubiquitin-protein ligase NRDP1